MFDQEKCNGIITRNWIRKYFLKKFNIILELEKDCKHNKIGK
jgi:hypothetical protein